jgi:hypothetical protein
MLTTRPLQIESEAMPLLLDAALETAADTHFETHFRETPPQSFLYSL